MMMEDKGDMALPAARATHEPSPDGLGHTVGVANAGFHLFENIFGGIGVKLADMRDCDMILLCLDTVQHKVVQIFLPHQLGADELLAMMDANGASSVTVMPYLNANKVQIPRKALAQAIEARRAETQGGSVNESAVRQDAPHPNQDTPHE